MKGRSLDYKLVGQRIVNVRKENKLSQSKLAQAINISPSYMSLIENGQREPSPDILVSICHVCGTSLNYLCLQDTEISSCDTLYKKLKATNGETDLRQALELADYALKHFRK